MTIVTPNEAELIRAAQGGDEEAYGQLVGPHRAELHAHCYRMLGSTADAEDAMQEALVRAWRGIGRFEGRSSVRTWLYRIATNACLKLIDRRPHRMLPVDYGPTADPHQPLGAPITETIWIDPYPTPEGGLERLESVELAFIAALQHLAPGPRAVLILRDVLGFSGTETAELLDTTPTAVYSSLQRAHLAMRQRSPGRSQQATFRKIGDEAVRAIANRYVEAWERRDVDALVALLTEDAVFSMPPFPTWFRGLDAIRAFAASQPMAPPNCWRLLPTWANAQLAFGAFGWDPEAGKFVAHSVNVVTLAGAHIAEVTAFLRPDPFPALGLPATLN
jgi:RNA polymerase sigma-70 factor (ECF subfamily)